MSTNPGLGGNSTSARTDPTTVTASGSNRRPQTHRMERVGVDFALPTATTKVESEAVSTSRAEVQSFSRMPSQRRRRLWTLAARAAARRQHPSQDKEALSSSSLVSKHLGELSTQSSSFLKPGTVRTQDSGISSMDYLTSREANSPNSEEAGFRQRSSLSLTTAEHATGMFRQPAPPPLPPHPPDVATTARGPRWPSPRATKIVVSGEAPMLRYANYCNAYVPEWARRNWSSAPRPLIPRQRSSMEVSYDIAPDWAASMETLNMQHALYPQSRGLFYGRYGRASCPKATTFFDRPYPTIHMEEENIAEKEGGEDEDSGRQMEAETALLSGTEETEHLRRRRVETPCWCERPPLPPPPHTCSLRGGAGLRPPTSMLSPYFHCSGCPYRGIETSMVPVHQCDLGQRHIRRRRLKRMSSEPTPPTWMSAEEAPVPAKRRPPPPEPLLSIISPPPVPRKNIPTAQLSTPLTATMATESRYSEARKITSTPKTDVFLMTAELPTWREEWGRPKRGGGGLMRGRSVDEAFYSPRWERQSSFLSDPRHPTYIYEEEEVKDWRPSQLSWEVEPVSGGPHHYHSPSLGVSYGIRPGSCRTTRTPVTWYPTSPHGAPILRPRSESGLRPLPPHACVLRPRGRRIRPTARSSATSSIESSDATAATATTKSSAAAASAPPWQLTSPLSAPRHHGASVPTPGQAAWCRKTNRVRGLGGGGLGRSSGVGSNDSTGLTRNKQRQSTLLRKDVNPESVGGHRDLDVKWKRKSFKRSNGYDAADMVERTPSTCLEHSELLPLRQEALLLPPNTATTTTTTTTIHESHEDEVEDVSNDATSPPPLATATARDSRRLEGCTPEPTARTPLKDKDEVEVVEAQEDAEEAETEEEEDIDKLVAAVRRPRSVLSGESVSRVQKQPTVGGELATLGFANRNDYWEHPAFGRSRATAIVIALVAICCLLYCLVATTWVYSGLPGNVTRRGLWRKCSVENEICVFTIPFISETDGWQGGATCILTVAILIGLLGIGLAVFGYSGSDLVKRLYYFHSSGEILFLAGFTTFLTFGIYRSYANLNLLNPRQTSSQPPPVQEPHRPQRTAAAAATAATTTTTTPSSLPASHLQWSLYYGAADCVGWGGGVLFMIAAVALLIDEFIHELARLGQTRWPRLGRCLHWCALRVTASNRRFRSAHRRCLGAFRRNAASASSSSSSAHTSAKAAAAAAAVIAVPYRPTTGASIKRNRRWRLQRQ